MNANEHPAPTLPPSSLSLEAVQLSMQLEHALGDPSATMDVFFQNIDQFADVLTRMRRHVALGVRPVAA